MPQTSDASEAIEAALRSLKEQNVITSADPAQLEHINKHAAQAFLQGLTEAHSELPLLFLRGPIELDVKRGEFDSVALYNSDPKITLNQIHWYNFAYTWADPEIISISLIETAHHEATHHGLSQLNAEGRAHVNQKLRDAGLSPFPYRDDDARWNAQKMLRPYALHSHSELGAVAREDRQATNEYSRVYSEIFASIFGPGEAAKRNYDRFTQSVDKAFLQRWVAISSTSIGVRVTGPWAYLPGDVELAYIKMANGHLYRVHNGTVLDVTTSRRKGERVYINDFFAPEKYHLGDPVATRPWETGNPWSASPIAEMVSVPPLMASTEDRGLIMGPLQETQLVREVEMALLEVDARLGLSQAFSTGRAVHFETTNTRLTAAELFEERPWADSVLEKLGKEANRFYRDGKVARFRVDGMSFEAYDPEKVYFGSCDALTVTEYPPLSATDVEVISGRINRIAERAVTPPQPGGFSVGL